MRLSIRTDDGREVELPCEHFSPSDSDDGRIYVGDKTAFEKIAKFVGQETFTIVDDFGNEFSACSVSDRPHCLDFAEQLRDEFGEQLEKVMRLREEYSVTAGETALMSRTQHVETAGWMIAARELLDAIAHLKSVARTEGQRQQADAIDAQFGSIARKDQALLTSNASGGSRRN
jgi:hypothetical protein